MSGARQGYRHHKVTVGTVEAAKAAFAAPVAADPTEAAPERREAPDAAAIVARYTSLPQAERRPYLVALRREYGGVPGIEVVQGRFVFTGPAMIAAWRDHRATLDPEERAASKARANVCIMDGCTGYATTDTPIGRICTGCRTLMGIPAPKVAQPVPMTDAEVAERRRLRAIEERTRRWDGASAADFPRDRPTVLLVDHHDDQGRPHIKMVGKLELVNVAALVALEAGQADWRTVGERELVFFHAHTPSQRHLATNCPSPVDTVVCDFLHRVGVRQVVAYERHRDGGVQIEGILRWASVSAIQNAPEAEYDSRWRRYLPEDRWTLLAGVGETMQKGGTRAYWRNQQKDVLFGSPFANERDGLRVRAGKVERVDGSESRQGVPDGQVPERRG